MAFICFQIYQDKALKDKERYRAEMENYREKLKTGQIVTDGVPLQQQLPNTNVMDLDLKIDDADGGESFQTPDQSSSGESDFEDDKDTEHNLEMDAPPGIIGMGAESSYLGSEKSSKEGEIEFQKKGGDDGGDFQAQKVDESKGMLAM